MIKIVFCLRRRSELSREEFQTYWRTTHAPLVEAHADALGIRRYVQVHSIDDAISIAVAGSRHSPEPFDGVAELWLDSLDALMAAGSSDAGRAAAPRCSKTNAVSSTSSTPRSSSPKSTS